MAMVWKYGSTTLSLTLSCAEYDSVDIDAFLRKVNNVSETYLTSKLCIENPVSVSRKFSQKFRDFFNSVLIKGAVLGKVIHFFWKKEYKSRAAPHYHLLLWIDAPAIGKHSEEEVFSWIQNRITWGPTQNYTNLLLSTRCISIVIIASGRKNMALHTSLL